LHYLKGDATKAKTELNWAPEISFYSMMDEMVDHWISVLQNKKLDFTIV